MTTPGPICCVTITTPDPDAQADAYERWLGYRQAARFRMPAGDAAYLGAPRLEGARVVLIEPEAACGFFFRFIEQPPSEGYRALSTHGWNAAELIVSDVDALADQLVGSPFRVIGPPEDLSFSDAIRAMQVLGPADEVLYLTMVKHALSEFDLPSPACAVDRAFIVVLGGANMTTMKRFYADNLSVPDAPVIEARISVLSRALGLPTNTRHPIAALPLAGQSLIEVDVYPDVTGPRPVENGHLPAAMAVVSIAAEELPARIPGHRLSSPPYDGRRAALLRGAAGELVELVAR